MPSGKTFDFGKKSFQIISLLSLGLGLSSCGIAKKADTCNREANGLSLTGFNGENLSDKHLSLVFLKGPSEVSEAIGSYLHHEHIEATFFFQGAEAHHHEAALEHLAEEGHRIATGGFKFGDLKSAEDPVLDLKTADALVTPFATGNQFYLYGEPGSLDANTVTQLNRAGLGKYLGPIHADTTGAAFIIDEQCWQRGLSVEVCATSYFDEIVRLGHGIIPFHDHDDRTLELLKTLIPELVAYGFSFTRLDEIPDVRLALTEVGGIPDADHSAKGCNDYE